MALSEPKEAQPASPPSGRTSATITTPAADNVSQEINTEPKEDHVKPEASGAEPETTGVQTWVIMLSVLMSTFLVALDRSIISTAIPAITNEFNSLSGYGWYGSAYLLTSCAFQLLFGKLYTFFPVKTVLLLSILLFEASSALCGAAPNSTAFIIGRAFCGVGSSGIFAGTVVCIVYIIPLHVRPKIQGAFGAFFGVAGISGPLIGGGLTAKVTWRWCFYLNLPIGGAAMAVIVILLKIPDQETTKLPLSEKLRKLDFPGTALFIPGVVCLLLALEWGGQTYPWGEWRIILLLVLAGVCLLGFTAVQIWMPTTATLPPRFFKQRSVLSAILATFGIIGGNYIYIYYLPTWFQSVQGVDSAQSGIRLLPLMITMIIGSIFGGISNTKIGYYTPLAIIGSCVMSVGAGLMTTFWVDTPQAEWIGYQVIYGFGMGLCFQVPNLAVQAVMAKVDQPVGLSLMLFCNLLSSTVFVSVGANVLNTQLLDRLSGVPGFEPSLVTSGGATSVVDALPAAHRDVVLAAYNASLQKVFRIALILCCISVIGCATLEWKNVKKGRDNMATTEAAAEAGQMKKAGGVEPPVRRAASSLGG